MDRVYGFAKNYIHKMMEQIIFINQYDLDQWIDETFTCYLFKIENEVISRKHHVELINYVAEYNEYHYKFNHIDFPIDMDNIWNQFMHIVAKIELKDYFKKLYELSSYPHTDVLVDTVVSPFIQNVFLTSEVTSRYFPTD